MRKTGSAQSHVASCNRIIEGTSFKKILRTTTLFQPNVFYSQSHCFETPEKVENGYTMMILVMISSHSL